jgi:hypothetical protein
MATEITLHCHNGNHDWQRLAQRGRKPFNCPVHDDKPGKAPKPQDGSRAAYVPKKRGRKSKAEAAMTPEAIVDHLEEALKLRGTHIAQHQS